MLELTVRDAVQADNLSEAVLFRMIDALRPTLLFDEVDAVFGKRNSDSADRIRQVLSSGYRKGKLAWRCLPRSHEPRSFNVYCPKATAGLHELPRTLAHRSIPIEMKPPLPTDVYEDLDRDEVEAGAETLRRNLQAWAEEADAHLRDPGFEAGAPVWARRARQRDRRILFRIADMAGGTGRSVPGPPLWSSPGAAPSWQQTKPKPDRGANETAQGASTALLVPEPEDRHRCPDGVAVLAAIATLVIELLGANLLHPTVRSQVATQPLRQSAS